MAPTTSPHSNRSLIEVTLVSAIGGRLEYRTREVLLKGRLSLSTIDLLVLTSLDQLLFLLKIFFTFFTKQVTLMRSSSVLFLPSQLVFPDRAHKKGKDRD